MLALTTAAWFTAAGQLALQALDDQLELDRFTAQVAALGGPPTTPPPVARDPLTGQVALTDLTDLAPIGQGLAGPLLGRYAAHYSLWWTAGSDRIAPCLLLCQGLPPPEWFAARLTGDWQPDGWQAVGRLFSVGENANESPRSLADGLGRQPEQNQRAAGNRAGYPYRRVKHVT